jgi:hypothetical protein
MIDPDRQEITIDDQVLHYSRKEEEAQRQFLEEAAAKLAPDYLNLFRDLELTGRAVWHLNPETGQLRRIEPDTEEWLEALNKIENNETTGND